MAKDIERPAADQAEQTEYRSMTAAAIVATPFVLAAQPIIGAWAEQHFSDRPKNDPPPQEPPNKG
jgi:hypothetical protein